VALSVSFRPGPCRQAWLSVFADRLGKSKSRVDKVERGVRRLDKCSVLQEIAEVLRCRPVGHEVLTEVLRRTGTDPPAPIRSLAEQLGIAV
jgi:transcriptional regulator with XRE-family HTH domain